MSRRALAAVALLALTAAACGSDPEGTTDSASDPAGTPSAEPVPVAVPDGLVRTDGLATVLDAGSPELCLGPVSRSLPPECSGPALLGWDWAEHEGTYDEQGGVRWAGYSVTGTWDGEAFTATDAVSAALYDPASPEPTPTPSPETAYDDVELEAIAAELGDTVVSSAPIEGHLLVDVYYDDGTLQSWADDTYGAGVVLVRSLLVDAG